MARYKHNDALEEVPLGGISPRFIAIDLERQLLPGSSEHALKYLVSYGWYALRLEVKHRQPCWLFAEKSGTVRIFKRADTALDLCRRFGLTSVTVHLQREPF